MWTYGVIVTGFSNFTRAMSLDLCLQTAGSIDVTHYGQGLTSIANSGRNDMHFSVTEGQANGEHIWKVTIDHPGVINAHSSCHLRW